MKTTPVTTLLVVLLSVTVLGTAGLTSWYVQLVREWGNWQGMAAEANRRLTVAQSLANDAAEYAKRNPKMEALLQAVNRKPQTAVTNTAQPAGK